MKFGMTFGNYNQLRIRSLNGDQTMDMSNKRDRFLGHETWSSNDGMDAWTWNKSMNWEEAPSQKGIIHARDNPPLLGLISWMLIRHTAVQMNYCCSVQNYKQQPPKVSPILRNLSRVSFEIGIPRNSGCPEYNSSSRSQINTTEQHSRNVQNI